MSPLRWRAVLAALAIFVLGTAVGATVTVGLGVRALRAVLRNPDQTRAPIDKATARIEADLFRDLRLSPAERETVHLELQQCALDLRALRTDSVQKLEQKVQGTVERIAARLPTERREAFYRLAERRLGWLGVPVRPLAPSQNATPAPPAAENSPSKTL